jgi:hypothetical protein
MVTSSVKNDQRILDAARKKMILADLHAPMSALATHASVGMSAPLPRCRSKEALLGQLCFDGLQQYIPAAERRSLIKASLGASSHVRETDRRRAHSLECPPPREFRPSKKLYREAEPAHEPNVGWFGRTKAAGVLRSDIEAQDIACWLSNFQPSKSVPSGAAHAFVSATWR